MANIKKQRFNHKYPHCTGTRCEFREDCIHFLAWQEAIALGLKNIQVQERCEDVTRDYIRVRIEPPKTKEN